MSISKRRLGSFIVILRYNTYADCWGAGSTTDALAEIPGEISFTISPREPGGTRDFKYSQKINAVRHVGQAAREIDGAHTLDDAEQAEIFGTTTYTLTHGGLTLKRDGSASIWFQ